MFTHSYKHQQKLLQILSSSLRFILFAVLLFISNSLIADVYYVSTKADGQVGSLVFKNEDILKFDTKDKSGGANGTWSLYFDGSDVGLGKYQIDGFFIDEKSPLLLLSFSGSAKVKINAETVKLKGSDIVKFNPLSLGENTSGTFDHYFKGSSVGLKPDVDALTLDETGLLILSTKGTAKLKNAQGEKFSAKANDLLRYTGTTGEMTAGSFELFFNGDQSGLTKNKKKAEPRRNGGSVILKNKNIDGVDIDNAFLYLTTQTQFKLGSVQGKNSDILRCDLISLPEACVNPRIILSFAALGLTEANVQGIQLHFGIMAADDLFTTDQDAALNQSASALFGDNGHGVDYDYEGDPLMVTKVNDNPAYVGAQITLASSALLTVNADGSFAYDPNNQFDYLALDAHTQDHFDYEVSDGKGDADQATVSITLTGKNDTPTDIALSNNSVAENLAADTVVGNLTTTDIDAGDTHIYALDGNTPPPPGIAAATSNNDNASFHIVNNQLQTAASFDFETKKTYSILVKTTDAGGLSYSKAFTINVTDGNDAPTDITLSNSSVYENHVVGTVVGELTSTDPDSADTHTYSLVSGTGGDDNALFQIVGGQLQTAASFDFETKASYTVRIRSTDSGAGNLTFEKAFNISITDINDAPVFTKGADQTVDEDAGLITVPAWATAIHDGDSGALQALTFNVTNNTNPNLFSVPPAINATSGTLTFVPADNEHGTATISFTLSDDGGTAFGGVDTSPVQTFVITVNSVNDAPIFTKGADQTVDEDAGAQSVAAWATAISAGPANESAQILGFSVTNNTNAALFSTVPVVDTNGNLTYTPAANANGSATITLQLTDSGSNTAPSVNNVTQTFTITVNSVNDAPSYTKGADQTLNEDAGAQTISNWASAISAGPADESAQTVGFSVTGNTNAALFLVAPAVAADGTLTYTPAAQANGSATITLQLTDSGSNSAPNVNNSSQTFTITVNSINDAPSFIKGTDQTVNEDAGVQTVNGWATAISAGPANESGQTLSFSVTNNSNPALFAAAPAVANDGTLTYTPAPDVNGSATITLKLTDSGSNTAPSVNNVTQTFIINVTAVNDAPSFAKGADQTVDEDAGAQTVNGWATVLSKGPADESAQSLSFNVTDNTNAALFSAGPAVDASGNLTYTPVANANGSATITLQLTDSGSNTPPNVNQSAAQTFVINITAVNDAPGFAKGADQTVDEDAGAQTVNGWATALSKGPVDESAQSLSFNVTDNTNAALFSAGPTVDASGNLTYTPVANANGNATITLQLVDSGSNTSPNVNQSPTQTFVINVTAVNDAPSFTKGPDQTLPFGAGAQNVTAWATAISPGPADESGQTVGFSVIANDNPGLFNVPPTVDASGNLSYTPVTGAVGIANISLQLTDNGSNTLPNINQSVPQTFTVTVANVNHAPSFTKGADPTVNEDAGAVSLAGWATNLNTHDTYEIQTLMFNVTGNTNAALFSVQPAISATGDLSFTPAANSNGSATITVTLKDSGGTLNGGSDTSASQSFIINVTPVNDAPSFSKGADQTVLEDAGAQSVNNWATALSKGPADESGQTLSFIVTNNTNAALFSGAPAVDASGTLTYTSAANANGSATVTLQLVDDGSNIAPNINQSATQTFVINVTAVDDPPVAIADVATVAEDSGANTLSVLVNDTDSDGGPKNVAAVGAASHGATAITGGGTGVSYAPASNYCNEHLGPNDSFTYTLNGGSSTTVTVTVNCVNDAPVGVAKTGIQIQSNMKRVGIDAALLTGVTDPDTGVDGCTSTFAVAGISSNTNGTVSNVSAGLFDFESNAGINGTAAATANYAVQDNGTADTNCPGPAQTSLAKSISFDVLGPVVWFVDDSATAGGDGRLGHEFQTVGAATAAIGGSANQNIFVYSGTYTQGASLNSNGWLIGQGASGSFDTVLGVTPPVGTIARPSLAGARPTLGNTVTMNTSSQVRGLNISSVGNTGITASTKTGLVSSEVSVTTTTGTAANFSSSGGTLSFTSISSNGAASGIILNSTTGSFTIAGTGSAGSGGTIQNGATGISLTSANNITLNRMQLNGFSDFAIHGTTVNGFTLADSVINGVNGNAASGEGSVRFDGLTGSASVSNCNISGGFNDNLVVKNTSGTLNRLVIDSTTIGANDASNGNDGIGIESSGAGTVMNVTVQNSAFTSAAGDLFQLNVINNSTADLVFTGNHLSNNHPNIATGGGGVTISGGDDTGAGANLTSAISNNTFRDALGHAILFVKSTDPGTFKANFSGAAQTIGVAGTANSGSLSGSGIKIQSAGKGTLTAAVTNNKIYQYNNQGIELLTGGSAAPQSGILNATLAGNTVSNPGTASGITMNGIHLNGGTVVGDTYQICTDIGGAAGLANSIAGSAGLSPNTDFRLRQRQATTVRLPGYGGANNDNAAVVSFVQGKNPGASGLSSNTVSTGGGYVGGAACALP